MKILLEANNLPELKIGDVKEVVEENDKLYRVNTETGLVWVLKSQCSVLVEPWEALKYSSEGKKIDTWGQCSRLWIPVTVNTYFSTKSHYRLKPEPPKPKYEPFTMDDWQEFAKMPVRSKTGNRFYFVASFNETNVTLSNTYTYAEALEAFEFIDGRPFGKEVKQ